MNATAIRNQPWDPSSRHSFAMAEAAEHADFRARDQRFLAALKAAHQAEFPHLWVKPKRKQRRTRA